MSSQCTVNGSKTKQKAQSSVYCIKLAVMAMTELSPADKQTDAAAAGKAQSPMVAR